MVFSGGCGAWYTDKNDYNYTLWPYSAFRYLYEMWPSIARLPPRPAEVSWHTANVPARPPICHWEAHNANRVIRLRRNRR